ncbi:MAG: 4Fe-4S binding protein [Oscillospiraceae bacterium]|nr:4Fe-4S binding protein [Oscillospiraceae bacterium]
MLRKIIQIDKDKCMGCGVCAEACHEGAIGMIDGKAELLRDDYCDGLGDCLPTCPTGAITFVEREAAAYDEMAVAEKQMNKQGEMLPCGCPGTHSKAIERNETTPCSYHTEEIPSQLRQWPVQIKLAPINAPYFQNANLLVAADCTAYAYGDFHNTFIKNKVTLIGCPKLDSIDYSDKLSEILRGNNIKSLTVVRMEVPCCGGLENAVKTALKNSGKLIPWRVVTISTDGQILEN